jgi:DNA repair photolyase
LLRRELPRKRKKPVLVYFSTACEPFIPYQPVLDSLYDVMKLLLENSVDLLISTKSKIPGLFLELFSKFPGRVSVQVGLTTSNDKVRKLIEPYAPTVSQRLETLCALVDLGIASEVRSDPLIPELTDTEESFETLCGHISQCGVKRLVASYLFLRRDNHSLFNFAVNGWSFPDMAQRLYTHRIDKYCGGGTIHIVNADYRRNKYENMKAIAHTYSIDLGLCRCKNPDLISECCHQQPSTRRESTPRQMTLFR